MKTARKLSASLEDYLEAIYHIEVSKKAARAKDIADRLRVKGASVTGALQALAKRKLVNYAPYDLVTLTDRGREAAIEVVQRHQALRRFFIEVLDVEPSAAEKAACRMEHSLPREIRKRLTGFMRYLDSIGERGSEMISEFKMSVDEQGEDEKVTGQVSGEKER